MTPSKKLLSLCLMCVSSLLSQISKGAEAERAPKGAVPAFKKVLVIIFENEDYSLPLAYPFFKKFSEQGAFLANYHAISHPSQPNYLAIISGSMHGNQDDQNVDLDGQHLADLLEAKAKTWKAYAEGYPSQPCFLDAKLGSYARKHVPFLSFKSISQNPQRCSKIVNASQFWLDIKNDSLPDLSFYVPDLNNDGHDTGLKYSDKWFELTVGPLLKDPKLKDLLIIATFDENSCPSEDRIKTQSLKEKCRRSKNQVYTAFVGPEVQGGSKSKVEYNHYSLLRTLEEGFGLGNLGLEDSTSHPIDDIWRK